jgi:hypothetical protein
MLTCDEFLDRLYSEELRRAMDAEPPGLLPEGLLAHPRACARCREELEWAKRDSRTMRTALAEPMPPGLVQRLQNSMPPVPAPAARANVFDGARALAWAASGAAIVAAVLSTIVLPPPAAGVGLLTWSLLGALVAAGASVARDALTEAIS